MAHNIDIQIKTIGLNTHGYKSNALYVSHLIQEYDIIFLSEHWLLKAEISLITDTSKPYHKSYFTPAEKKLSGRPYGGNCFIVRNTIAEVIEVVYQDSSIMAIKFTKLNSTYLCIGIYLTSYHDNSSIESYNTELNILTSLIKTHSDECEILLIGDFQTFPSVIYDDAIRNNCKRNPLSKPLCLFLEGNCLELIDVTNGNGPTQTYQHKTLPNSSYIDHIATFRDHSLSYKSCEVHLPNEFNMGDHQPVSITILWTPKIDDIIRKDVEKFLLPKLPWNDQKFIDQYQKEVANSLVNCDTDEHEVICKKLMQSATTAYSICFPEKKSPSFSKPWWNQETNNAKELLSVHFNAWKENGFSKENEDIFYNEKTSEKLLKMLKIKIYMILTSK